MFVFLEVYNIVSISKKKNKQKTFDFIGRQKKVYEKIKFVLKFKANFIIIQNCLKVLTI